MSIALDEPIHIDTSRYVEPPNDDNYSSEITSICIKSLASNPSKNLSKNPSKNPSKTHRKCWARVLKKLMSEVRRRSHVCALMGTNVTDTQLDLDTRVETLSSLRNLPQPEQRSDSWYVRREEMITASDFGKALKSDAARTTFAKQKATPLKARRKAALCNEVYIRPPRRNGGSACQHGIMFEPVCDMVYRQICRPGAITEEFGLLPHPTVSYLGASPDGICNESSPISLIGRLIEYKAPISRPIIQGIIPEAYLVQMQGQLEVTGLDECDYLECAFVVHSHEDVTKMIASETPPEAYGIIITYQTVESSDTKYCYGPWNRIDNEAVFELLDRDTIPDDACILYWTLNTYQLATIRRNKIWCKTVLLPALNNLWERIQFFSEQGS